MLVCSCIGPTETEPASPSSSGQEPSASVISEPEATEPGPEETDEPAPEETEVPAPEDEDEPDPYDERCKSVNQATLKQIRGTFVAPVGVIRAYQVTSEETRGLTFITLATQGFPKGVFAKTGELAAPTYATHKRRLYTASGQAIRFSEGSKTPNITDNDDLIFFRL